MFLDLSFELGQIELCAILRRERGTIVKIVEKMLVGIRARRSVFRKRLEYQISLRGVQLMEAAFDHGELVVTRSGVAAHFHVSSEKLGGLFQFLVFDAQVRQLQQRVGEIRIRTQRLLQQLFGFGVISLMLLDIAHVKQAGSVAWIELETFLKVFPGFFEPPEMAVREAHKRVRAWRGIQLDQVFELFDGLFHLAGHEIALAQSGV